MCIKKVHDQYKTMIAHMCKCSPPGITLLSELHWFAAVSLLVALVQSAGTDDDTNRPCD